MIDLEAEYRRVATTQSDINEHVPTLRYFASRCALVTELGTGNGNSTIALMAARPIRLVSYDVTRGPMVAHVEAVARACGIDFTFRHENPSAPRATAAIDMTDFLFVDTDHYAEQCARELALHAGVVTKYIGFHDTTTFWEVGQGLLPGLRYAIEPFLATHPEWREAYRAENCNGLMILERA